MHYAECSQSRKASTSGNSMKIRLPEVYQKTKVNCIIDDFQP